jgi:HAD superfamily hydrolase (TIGR01509 family)
MLKALIFDFDGLILDTETPEYQVWKNIYQENGHDLPLAEWGNIIGGSGISNFDPAEHLSHLLSSSQRAQGRLDPASLRARHSSESYEMTLAQPVLPGVLEMIHAAKEANIKLAIASSSPHSWVDTHAKRLGIFHYFDKVICRDDVGVGRTKPNPDLFLLALDQLQVQKEAAVVFEDSPNGVKAAHRAGIFVVAVPNPVTSLLVIEDANLILSTLSGLPLSELMSKVQ